MDRQPFVSRVHHDVAPEETREFLVDQPPHRLLVDMRPDERDEARQEAVWEGLAINFFQDAFGRQVVCLEEGLGEPCGYLPLQAIAYEPPPQDRPAPFVAQDKAQGRYLFADLLSVVKARVRASPEDAGNARLRPAKRVGRRPEVAPHHDPRGDVRPYRPFHAPVLFWERAPRAIEVNHLDARAGGQLGEEVAPDRLFHFRLRLVIRVHARRAEMVRRPVRHARPLRLGRTAIGYQYHAASFPLKKNEYIGMEPAQGVVKEEYLYILLSKQVVEEEYLSILFSELVVEEGYLSILLQELVVEEEYVYILLPGQTAG